MKRDVETIAARMTSGGRRLVKVCGITTLDDARASIEGGADALGFNFYPRSPRYIDPAAARRIIEELPAGIIHVGVIVIGPKAVSNRGDSLDETIARRIEVPGPQGRLALDLPRCLQALQVHGAASQDDLEAWGEEIIVGVAPETATAFPDHSWIVDTSWGSGRLADWTAAARLERPYILSGGLTEGNVGEAVRRLQPAGIDVCSGVESEPGRKDRARLRAFLAAARKE